MENTKKRTLQTRQAMAVKVETLRYLPRFADGDFVYFIIDTYIEPNQYGQNVVSYVSQSKEDREKKMPKQWIGNGRTIWKDGKSLQIRKESKQSNQGGNDNLPF